MFLKSYLKSQEDLQPGILSRKDADISDNIFLKNILEQPHVENEQSSPIKYYQHSKYWKLGYIIPYFEIEQRIKRIKNHTFNKVIIFPICFFY